MTLRQKLSLGFGGLVLVVAAVCIYSVLQFREMGRAVDIVLRENYESILACLEMKESLDRMDDGTVFIMLGHREEGLGLLAANGPRFEAALARELGNLTIPGEGEKASYLEQAFGQYRSAQGAIGGPETSRDAWNDAYFSRLLPLSQRIRETIDEILRMNQENMVAMDRKARRQAVIAERQMYIMLLAAMALSAGFLFLTGKYLLRPITNLTLSADQIRLGNLDLVVQSASKDEIGRLSETFNAMAASLRELRRTDHARLLRSQRSIQQALNSLPDVIAVLEPDGVVEVSTEAAKETFGLKPSTRLRDLPYPWLTDIVEQTLRMGRQSTQRGEAGVVQHFVRGEERFFQPQAIPIMDSDRQPAGVVLVLRDVTGQRHQDEMKGGVISTVSHQLKTPLTSVRMALHLLLEEKVGSLTEKQAEILVAAREEAERLDRILRKLLDIGRIESGKTPMDIRPIAPQAMVSEAVEPYRSAARDGGVSLKVTLTDALPRVWVDPAQIAHVFANLLSNALKYTPPGGTIVISGEEEGEAVRFHVSDTGVGIPEKYLPRIFEQFFRVPEQGMGTGVGLGLAIVKDIVEAHGGTVGVKSCEGAGSSFTFSLRRADPIRKEGETL